MCFKCFINRRKFKLNFVYLYLIDYDTIKESSMEIVNGEKCRELVKRKFYSLFSYSFCFSVEKVYF